MTNSPPRKIAVMGAEGAVGILYRRELQEAADPAERRAELVQVLAHGSHPSVSGGGRLAGVRVRAAPVVPDQEIFLGLLKNGYVFPKTSRTRNAGLLG